MSKFIVISFILTSSILSFTACDYNRRLNFVPKALKVSKIIYASEESSGVGPGGNEAGVIVYELPNDVAQEIKKNGAKFFSDLSESEKSNDDLNKRYQEWEETPLLSDPSWRETPVDKIATPDPRIENYVNQYVIQLDIEPAVADEINSIVAKPGSYFAKGRSSIIIVSPDAKKVIYTYNG